MSGYQRQGIATSKKLASKTDLHQNSSVNRDRLTLIQTCGGEYVYGIIDMSAS